jgi:hypothetical protein
MVRPEALPRSRGARVRRIWLAVASWVAAVSVVEASVGSEIGQMARQLEERLELQIQGPPAAPLDPHPPAQRPERTRDDSIEPWELVSV